MQKAKKAIGHTARICMALCSGAAVATETGEFEAGVSSSTIRITDNTIASFDARGRMLKSGKAGTDDAAIIQEAIDRPQDAMGGRILLHAGKYVLSKSIVVSLPVRIVGEGRSTEIKPPKGDSAFRASHDGRSLERHCASFREPKDLCSQVFAELIDIYHAQDAKPPVRAPRM